MNDFYAEASASRAHATDTKIKKGAIIVSVILCFFVLPAISVLFLFFGTFAVMAAVFIYPKLNVVYEYIFVDGQFDFDKIMGNVKRKTLLRIDLEKIEIAAPFGSHELDSYKGKEMKIRDFTSGSKDKKGVYVMIGYDNNKQSRILFEPSKQMLEFMKAKAPRKVFLD